MQSLLKYRETIFLAGTLLAGIAIWFFRPEKNFFQSICDFESTAENWTFDTAGLTEGNSRSGNKAFRFDGQREFGPTFSYLLDSAKLQRGDHIEASVFAFLENDLSNPFLVTSLARQNGEVIKWEATFFKRFISKNQSWQPMFFSLPLDPGWNKEPLVLSVYVWNRNKENFFIDDFKVSLHHQEPIIISKRD